MRQPGSVSYSELLSDSELFNDRAVTLDIYLLEVAEKVTAMTYHLKKTSSAVVVLLVYLEMLGKRVDSRGKNSDLYFGGTCVALMNSVFFDDCLLFSLCDHNFHLIKILADRLSARWVKDLYPHTVPTAEVIISRKIRFVNTIFKKKTHPFDPFSDFR